MKKSLFINSFILSLFFICNNSFAQSIENTSSTTFNVYVKPECKITTTSNISFSNYDPLVSDNDLRSNGYIGIKCTNGLSGVQILLSEGSNPRSGSSCDVPKRQMVSNGNYLSYQIYLDGSNTNIWGCSKNTGKVLPNFNNLNEYIIETHGLIYKNQNIPIGNYVDTIEVRVTF